MKMMRRSVRTHEAPMTHHLTSAMDHRRSSFSPEE
jgi:hypothetical protein